MSDGIDVKALRESCGWTQEQLAGYLGLDRSSVSRMESGQKPKGSTIKLLERLKDNPPQPGARPAEAAE